MRTFFPMVGWIVAGAVGLSALAPFPGLAQTKSPSSPPPGSPEQTCSLVKKNPDGSWSPVKPTTFYTPDGPIDLTPGMKFYPDVDFRGFYLADEFNTKCAGLSQGYPK